MRRPTFIARQAARPTGLIGRALVSIMAIETRALNDAVLGRLAVQPSERILEIGFGHGRTLQRAAEAHRGARFAGIDHSDEMVRTVSRRCAALVKTGALDLRAGDSSALPWPAASFDGIFAVHTVYFWPTPERDIAEVRRVLRGGGRFVIGFSQSSPEREASFPSAIYRFRSADEVRELLGAAGLSASLVRGPGPGLWVADARAP